MSPQLKQLPKVQQQAAILVVDNEAAFRKLLSMALQRLGYLVYTATNGVEALKLFAQMPFDLVFIDIMMPEMDGYTLCAELRKRSIVPIILVSALNQTEAIARGFTLGADDFIAKPFYLSEVEVRLRALLRRTACLPERANAPLNVYGDIVLNNTTHEVYIRGDWVHLSPTEFLLLACLLQRSEHPLSKNELAQSIWGQTLNDATSLVAVTIRRLREKIEPNPSKPVYLLTIRGFGYKFNTSGAGSMNL